VVNQFSLVVILSVFLFALSTYADEPTAPTDDSDESVIVKAEDILLSRRQILFQEDTDELTPAIPCSFATEDTALNQFRFCFGETPIEAKIGRSQKLDIYLHGQPLRTKLKPDFDGVMIFLSVPLCSNLKPAILGGCGE